MVAALIVVVVTLFFLGIGLLISTNILVILLLSFVGLILGSGIGFFFLRESAPEGHWALFAGPVAAGLLFVLLCGVLNLLLDDNLRVALPDPLRMYTIVFLLTAPLGLFLGYYFSASMSGSIREQRGSGRASTPSVGARPPRQSRGSDARASVEPDRAAPRPTLPPPPASGGATGGFSSAQQLIVRLNEEVPTLKQFGQVQVVDLQDGTACVIVTRTSDQVAVYMVCHPSYPERPPDVSVEQPSRQQTHTNILFTWNSTSHRLKDIVADWMRRL
ncbi:hypothetical protein HC928_07230 [bacterium]|nr:hypothetical protein [bacterium]